MKHWDGRKNGRSAAGWGPAAIAPPPNPPGSPEEEKEMEKEDKEDVA